MSILSLFAGSDAPVDVWSDPRLWLPWSGAGQTRQTKAGELVNAETALGLSAYFAALQVISEDVAKVPASEVERLPASGRRPGGRRPVDDSAVTRFFSREFNPETSATHGRETLTQWALGHGKGMAEIERDGNGKPLALWPIHPTRVKLSRRNGALGWLVKGLKPGDPDVWLADVDVFHVHGMGDGVEGYSVLRYASEALGLGLAAQSFGAEFFGQDLAVGATFTLKTPLDAEGLKDFRAHMKEQYGADGSDRRGLLVVNGDGHYERPGIPPEEAQFLETRTFQVEDVARWFRVSPRKIGHKQSAQGWATLDAEQTDHVTDCLLPWWRRWEDEADRKLIGVDVPNRCLKHFVQGLMRGDVKTRTEYYRARQAGGSMTANEVRELEDENPLDEPNADEPTVQGATVLLASLSKDPVAPVAPPAAPSSPASDAPSSEGTPPPYDASAMLRPFIDEAAARVVRKECRAVEAAFKKHSTDAPAFQKWATGFYSEQRTYAAEAFATAAKVASKDGPAALAALSAALWPDVVARTGKVFRVKESDLAALLAEQVIGAVIAPREETA